MRALLASLRAGVSYGRLATPLAVVWLVLAWILRPTNAVLDWMGWRQADTQTIALNLTTSGSSMLKPAIAWGGDGPGYVEAEFQLYTALAAGLMSLFGRGEWAPQLVSLACVAGTLAVLGWHLSHRYGAMAALFGLGAFLGARSVAHAATAIQPEALCLLAYTVAWACLARYLENGSRRFLLWFALAGGVAMLVKPTAAQLGISSGILVLFAGPARLRRWEIWAAWGGLLLALALHLLWARELYQEYGNTFGVLSGGDSKLPKLEHLLMPGALLRAAKHGVVWGVGWAGALALLVLAARRSLTIHHVALIVGNAVWVLLALRYTSTEIYGSMYFVLASVLGAEAVASVVASPVVDKPALRWATACLLVALAVHVGWLRYRARDDDEDARQAFSAGRALRAHASTGELVAVRSPAVSYDAFWRTKNNFEDPRVFYVSGTRGWVLGADERGYERVEALRARGARYYVEPRPVQDENLRAWLEKNSVLLAATPEGGRVFRLRVAGAR